MKKKDKPKVLKSVKVSEDVWKLVRANKEASFHPIGVFFEKAALEKLEKEKK